MAKTHMPAGASDPLDVFAGGGEMGAMCVFQDISELREMERAREEFLSSVAHDLKTPLTGIGLASARQIVVDHGGTISVESREGSGSTFMVRLPLTAS